MDDVAALSESPKFSEIPVIPDSVIYIHAQEADEIVHVNSSILAQHSPFFQKLFTTEMRGSRIELHVENISEIYCLIQFMYYGEKALASLSQKEIFSVLEVADMYQVTSCVVTCMAKLRRWMTTDLALECLETLPDSNLMQPLKAASEEFLRKNLSLGDCEDLPPSVMESLLKSDEFHSKARSEYAVYEMLLRWAEASEERQLSLSALMDHVRFSIMTVADNRRVYEGVKLKQVPVNESTRKKIKTLALNGVYILAELGPTQAIEVFTDRDFSMHVGTRVFGSLVDKTMLRIKFWVKLPIQTRDLQKLVKEAVTAIQGDPAERQRIWAWEKTSLRPSHVIKDDDTGEVVPAPVLGQPLYFYSEIQQGEVIPDVEKKRLVFVTFYDPGDSAEKFESLSYFGRLWVDAKARASEAAEEVRKMTGCFDSSIYEFGGIYALEWLHNSRIKHGITLCCSKNSHVQYLNARYFIEER